MNLLAMDGVDLVVVILTMRVVVSMDILKTIQPAISVKLSVCKNQCALVMQSLQKGTVQHRIDASFTETFLTQSPS